VKQTYGRLKEVSDEQTMWTYFKIPLPSMKDKKLFDQMFSLGRLYNSICIMKVNPASFRSVMMSMLFPR
jgi:hypothetical protein